MQCVFGVSVERNSTVKVTSTSLGGSKVLNGHYERSYFVLTTFVLIVKHLRNVSCTVCHITGA